uniref:Pre-mRNA-splicing regulator WTAP (Trinotate prediction) n=1 Tax=Henneguya salminicola TaxID=69463 RepID=A0A6G3MIF1_HENSL
MEIFIEDKSKNEPSDNTIRENFFIMKLATKDQELREALAQIQALKAHISSPIAEKLYISNQQPQVLPTVNDVTSVINSDKNILEDLNNIPTTYLTDPALNYLYSKVLEEIEKYKSRLNDAEDELKGANFNLDRLVELNK